MSWLWKSDASSPASYEKALSKLSTQITSANLSLESTRSRARRVKALWSIYTIIAYILYALIAVLVLGPQGLKLPHYIGLVGGPIVIYGVRMILALLFDWQISRKQSNVEFLQNQREEKITQLKKATKFDSTQELLQKYGGAPKQTPSRPPQQGTKRKIASPQPQRTGIAPPPTANIPGRNLNVNPSSPQSGHMPITPTSNAMNRSPPSAYMLTTSPPPDEPGFAPNAFGGNTEPRKSSYDRSSNWYDRILDALIGEDETLAKNRLALICSNCRLVNGQAPPGMKTVEEVGTWKCASCGAKNGLENEASKILKEMTESIKTNDEEPEGWQNVSRGEDASEDLAPGQQNDSTEDKPAVKEIEDREDEGDYVKSEETSKGKGTGREAGSGSDAQEISKRVTRSTQKYFDEDQGW